MVYSIRPEIINNAQRGSCLKAGGPPSGFWIRNACVDAEIALQALSEVLLGIPGHGADCLSAFYLLLGINFIMDCSSLSYNTYNTILRLLPLSIY